MSVRRWWSLLVAVLGVLVGVAAFDMGVFLTDALIGQSGIIRRDDSASPELWVIEALCAVLVVGGAVFAALPDPLPRRKSGASATSEESRTDPPGRSAA